nr:unnamed protein product [Callosobruchus analis]
MELTEKSILAKILESSDTGLEDIRKKSKAMEENLVSINTKVTKIEKCMAEKLENGAKVLKPRHSSEDISTVTPKVPANENANKSGPWLHPETRTRSNSSSAVNTKSLELQRSKEDSNRSSLANLEVYTSPENDTSGQNDGTGWTVVKRKSNKKKYPEQDRSKPVYGQNTDFKLTAAVRRSYLLVTGLDVKTTEEELEQYLQNTLEITCKASKMITRKDKFKSSFKLEIPTEARDAILSPNLWGKGIVVNHFLYLRRRPSFREDRKEPNKNQD